MVKPGAKKSIVWKFFSKSPDNLFVTCSICKKNLKFFKNTTNLKEHLVRIHPIQYTESTQLPQEEVAAHRETQQPSTSTSTNVNVPSISSASASTSSTHHENENNFPDFPPSKRPRYSRQLKLYGSTRDGGLSDTAKQELDMAIVKMIVVDYQPLSIVENRGFLEYSNKLQPLYKPPSRKQLTSVLIPRIYNECVTKLKTKIDSVEKVAITTDMLSSDSNKAYTTVTCHFIFENTLHASVLATNEVLGAHTGENIASVLSNIFKEWGIARKIVTIVSDNGANIKNAINEHLKQYHHPCVAHTLNLSVKEALSSIGLLDQILKKCRTIVGHFKHSVQTTEKLKITQKQMNSPEFKVKQDVPTRWNSVLIMMERLLVIKDCLTVTLSNLPRAPQTLDAAEWEIVADCSRILKPMESITRELSGEKYPTMSIIIPLIRGLQFNLRRLSTNTETGEKLRQNLIDVVNRRLGSLESNKVAAKATFLDPRFKKVGFGIESNGKTAESWVLDELASLINTSNASMGTATDVTEVRDLNEANVAEDTGNPNSIWEHFDSKASNHIISSISINPVATATIVVRQYIEMPLLERRANPLEFWKAHRRLFPELYKLAMRYLCVPSTSVPSERVFSKCGQLTNVRRNRLDPKNLNQIVFLNGEM